MVYWESSHSPMLKAKALGLTRKIIDSGKAAKQGILFAPLQETRKERRRRFWHGKKARQEAQESGRTDLFTLRTQESTAETILLIAHVSAC